MSTRYVSFVFRHSLSRKRSGFYFIVRAKNGKTLATSEVYNTRRACLSGAKALYAPLIAERCARFVYEDVDPPNEVVLDFRPAVSP